MEMGVTYSESTNTIKGCDCSVNSNMSKLNYTRPLSVYRTVGSFMFQIFSNNSVVYRPTSSIFTTSAIAGKVPGHVLNATKQ